MNIIAGELSGRSFQAPKGERTHPMSTKARGALFNILGDIEGLTLLDGFAGSGAASFEALSRGARHATLIDNDRRAQAMIEQNIKQLELAKKTKLIKATAQTWSTRNPQAQFDLIVLDPPYDQVQLDLLQKLTQHLRPSGTLVVSWPSSLTAPELTGLHIVKQKAYGDATLVFYQLIQ